MKIFWPQIIFKNFGSMIQRNSYEKCPLIVIIGATGCGKTKLSLELAEHFKNMEIISADSMQIYKGLDIATNKATKSERSKCVHHLIDIVDPFKQFTVIDFQKQAMKCIDQIIANEKIPIIVGGTNYYIESILWDTLIGQLSNNNDDDHEFQINPNFSQSMTDEDLKTVEDLLNIDKFTYRNLRFVSDEKLFELLQKIDPESAKILHMNNRRKIIRCLQVFKQTGQRMSEVLNEQRQSEGSSRHGGPLRFKNSIILWVDCDKSILDERLDKRVDEMISNGLLAELEEFHREYNSKLNETGKKADYTEGIFQTIGLKEFHQYLLLNEEERNTYVGQLKLGHGIILLKQRTKTYVTKQMKWIRRRFLISNSIRNVPNVYRLDTSKINEWKQNVRDRAIDIVDKILEASNIATSIQRRQQIDSYLNEIAVHRSSNTEKQNDQFISGQFYCDICKIKISGGDSYRKHLKSKKHQYQLKHMENKS